MSFAIISQTITGNSSCNFDFSSYGSSIGAFIYGIQCLNLYNGTAGAQLQNFGVTYTLSDGTGVGYSQVTLTQNLAEGLDTSQSSTTAVVIAYMGGTNPPGIFMSNPPALPVGLTGLTQNLEYPPAVAASVLAGFNLSFQSSSSDLLGLGAGVGIVSMPGSTGFAPLVDGSLLGDSSYSGTVNAGSLLLQLGQAGLSCEFFQTTQSSTSINTNFQDGATWCALIQSFYVQFDVDTDPTPDLVSLNIAAIPSSSPPTGNATISMSGQIRGSTTPYGGGGSTPASATNTILSLLLVALT